MYASLDYKGQEAHYSELTVEVYQLEIDALKS